MNVGYKKRFSLVSDMDLKVSIHDRQRYFSMSEPMITVKTNTLIHDTVICILHLENAFVFSKS